MTSSLSLLLVVLALLVAVAAAVRSTWSPCGLSMLSTITPFGERAKGHRYGATATWFILGATVGGLALGAGRRRTGRPSCRPPVATAAAIAAAAMVATSATLVSDTGLAGFRVPAHYRQVNERWLDAYRPWVYGAGFGFQIGSRPGHVHHHRRRLPDRRPRRPVRPPAGRPGRGPRVRAGPGRGGDPDRGAPPTPTALLAFHQRFAALLPWADRGVVASLLVTVVALVVAVGAAVADCRVWRRRGPGRRGGAPVRVAPPARPGGSRGGRGRHRRLGGSSCADRRAAGQPGAGPLSRRRLSPRGPGPPARPTESAAVATAPQRALGGVGAVAGLVLGWRAPGRAASRASVGTGPAVRPAGAGRRPPVPPRRSAPAATRGGRPRLSHRCSSRNRSMPHSTMPTPSTMPAGGRGADRSGIGEPSEATAGVRFAQEALHQQQDAEDGEVLGGLEDRHRQDLLVRAGPA